MPRAAGICEERCPAKGGLHVGAFKARYTDENDDGDNNSYEISNEKCRLWRGESRCITGQYDECERGMIRRLASFPGLERKKHTRMSE